jgi:heme-degrading monooxygenase HmoA
MAVAAVFTFPRSEIALYDKHLELYGEALQNQPARRSHVCFETDDGYMVVDVWDSLEAFEQFGNLIVDMAEQTRSAGGGQQPMTAFHLRLRKVHNFI